MITNMLFSFILITLSILCYYLYEALWLKPEKLRNKLRNQGIMGQPPSFLSGNVSDMMRIKSMAAVSSNNQSSSSLSFTDDYMTSLFPHFEQWRKEYVKEISLCQTWALGKPLYLHKEIGPLFGNGVVRSNGKIWAHQRKTIAPEFFTDKVKGMVGIMVASTVPVLRLWEDEIEKQGVAENRRQESIPERDLLHMILEGANNLGEETANDFIVDNCKNIYIAGDETVASVATWALLFLASHPQWQTLAREEVLQLVPEGCLPDAEMLHKMKILTMVLQETLRLMPPTSLIAREVFDDVQFGDIINIPEGINFWIPISTLHRNLEIWGPDANEFKPERFVNGILGATKVPHAYIMFGLGPRTCLGQKFAIAELKIMISLILSKFCFSSSPNYKHAPAFTIVIVPKHGLQLLYLHIYIHLWLKPEKIRKKLRNQGIKGPTPSFLSGNVSEIKSTATSQMKLVTDDYMPSLFPHLEQWRMEYGPTFMYETGTLQHLYVGDPNLVKEMSLCQTLAIGKPTYRNKELAPLFGTGVGMVGLMVKSAMPVMRSCEDEIVKQGGIAEIRVDEGLRNLSADVISRACFGSSYSQGTVIFAKLEELIKALYNTSSLISSNQKTREVWRLEKEIRKLILDVIKKGKQQAKGDMRLLQMILESDDEHLGQETAKDFIVDNCKSIYVAGHETVASVATWTLMFLSSHPEWQTRARDEVLQNIPEGSIPHADMLHKMKILTMVIQETLRLLPPTTLVSREAFEDLKFGDIITIPKGTNFWMPISTVHRIPEIWGPDADKFNPERFAHGVFGACKIPQAYIPFGTGSRTCLGQKFAMVELKIVLSLMLSKFGFSLSPNYRHSPAFSIVIVPKHGMHLLVEKLSARESR
ncbi:hypothetical protein C5167_045422 [Papaver somniferum]|uniref:Cytochrome P450 n=1 Tax=Papaver somniferum TaxID=3469 RepID=A0A4Y7LBL9_PAPSO|nr:hypothetical protein C5167_045422 [Papaver somniferum]